VGVNGHTLLLDCGIHPKKEGVEALPNLTGLTAYPEAVIISHGHIDHCGAVPYLLKMFSSTELYATAPTVRIMDRMLHNSVSVMDTLGLERGIQEYPLYSHRDVERAVRRAYGMEFDQEFAVTWTSPVRVSFHHAGHVLGSACILVKAPDHTLLYTGDICLSDQELMRGAALPDHLPPIDTLVIESTRGAHVGAAKTTYEGEIQRFADEASAVLGRGGTVLVPSFALGRTQEMLNIISRLQFEGALPEVPIYASGLGRAVYEIYDEFTGLLRPGVSLQPLRQYHRIGDVWERRVARKLLREPAVIVTTSGMMVENTPSAMIARELVQDNRHAVFFVGYLDPETLGYKLLHARKGDPLCFELHGPAQRVELDNRQSFTFSAHAHREDLCRLVERLAPKNVVFVHGDPEAIEWMNGSVNGRCRKFAPSLGETIVLEA
jgi:Cft2 family RNA processing exonuclease